MIERGYVTGGDGSYDPKEVQSDHRTGFGHDVDYAITDSGKAFLDEIGVRVPEHRRVIRYCIDWSEQRHHLSGALGRGLLDRLLELDWIRRSDVSRAVGITDAGRLGLHEVLGIRVSA